MLYSHTIKLIRFYEGADGLKTGHTDDAGYCLAVTAKQNHLRLIAIVLGEADSKVRNSEVMDLLDYGFQSVEVQCLKKKGSVIDSIHMDMIEGSIPVSLEEDLCVLEAKGEEKNYSYDINISPITLPIHKGDVVGKIDVLDNHKVIMSGNLIVNKDINKISLLQFLKNNYYNFMIGVF